MSRAIVGYSGFVGSNLLQFYKFDYFYNSQNFHEAKNQVFDEIFFTGVPAVKWKANKYVQEDIDVIDSIKDILKTIQTNRIVLISTIDVYDDVTKQYTEDYDCDWIINHPYGRHRYLFEIFVKDHFKNHHIIRLPALFGKGLKKNIIFDLMNNNQLQNIPINSTFQWYSLEWLKQDIDRVIENNIPVCNLFTEPLETKCILDMFHYPMTEYLNNTNELVYNTSTKYGELFSSSVEGYIRDKRVVEESIRSFIDFNKIDKSHLCVSNICIEDISQFQFTRILKLFDIKHVQIAPTTMIDTWDHLANLNLDVFTKNDLIVHTFQSITFTLNEWNIFSELRHLLFDHLKKVIDSAIHHGVKILVFGCPRNRKIQNTDNTEKNDNTFVDFFKKVGEYCLKKDITICIEQNSKQYNCNYLNTIKEVGEIVKRIDHEHIKMMVDIGNAVMETDDLNDIYLYKEYIYNIDVANEHMKPLLEKSDIHFRFNSILSDIQYNKIVNLEMLINDPLNELSILTHSLNTFVNIYGK
jgi:sugar phosphate isomerase/epimerase